MYQVLKNSILLCTILTFCGCSFMEGKKEKTPEEKEASAKIRAKAILDKMTLEEKIDYIGGLDQMYIRPIERLKLPAIKMSDGPMGVRTHGKSTYYPAGIGLAASWNPDLAKKFGASIANDCRARGVHVLLAPGMNIYRSPICGRNFEYLGEDPLLASAMVVEIIKGVQSKEVLATAKHYACNNFENGRHYINSIVDERTMYEIYLPAFRASVVDAKAACVMSAYNKFNGPYCTENDWLNNQVLKKYWKFDGILMSDWEATHDGVAAFKGGLDLEMPSGKYMNQKNLTPALNSGKITEEVLNDKIMRILTTLIKYNFLDRPQLLKTIPADDPESDKVALEMAREEITLLKNEKNILPLNPAKIKKIAVIGPSASPGVPAGGGSSNTEPFHSVSMLDGIKAKAGAGITVTYDPGSSSANIGELADKSVYKHKNDKDKFVDGLKEEYFDNKTLNGKPVKKSVVSKINYNFQEGGFEEKVKDNFSIRWTGYIIPEKSGMYKFYVNSDDGIRVFIDGKKIIDQWGDHAERSARETLYLKGKKEYKLKVEYYESSGSAIAQFAWAYAEPQENSPAVKAAKDADVVIVCAGFGKNSESEGSDRAFEMPDDQGDMIRAVAEANPNTVVVLTGGGGVDWGEWLDRVPGLLHAWYPGQQGGTAVAEILFGEVNPSGKIPATFEKKMEDNPVHPNENSKDDKNCEYTEGIFVGYRGYEKNGTEPQFYFGHGLSYTSFEYSDITVSQEEFTAADNITVKFKIKNSGKRPGAEIAQLYVSDVKSSVPRPIKELKGFKKVFLQPGETKEVSIVLGKDAFSFFDPVTHDWKAEPGKFKILVGASSKDLRLNADIEMK